MKSQKQGLVQKMLKFFKEDSKLKKIKKTFAISLVGILLILGLTTRVVAQDIYPLSVTSGDTWDIGSDSNNNVYIIWYSSRNLYFAQIVNHAVTGQQLVTSNVSISKYCIPRLSVQPNGQSMSIVYDTTDRKNLMHAWRDSGGSWHNETIVGPLSYNIYYPAGAVGGDGTVHVVYALGTPYNKLYYKYKSATGAWSSQIELGYPNPESTRMIVDPSGGIHVTWMPYTRILNYRYAELGSTLNNSVTETITGTSTIGTGGLAATHSGFVHVSPNFDRKIWHTYKPIGSGSFSKLTCPTITSVAYTELVNNSVGADETGRVIVSWSDQVGGVYCVKVSVLQDKVWTPYTIDSQANTGSLASTFPGITITNSTGYLLWRHIDNHLYLAEYPFNSIEVESPNGGESMSPGSIQDITWTSSNLTGNIKIELLKGQTVLGTIVDNLNITYSPYLWTAGNYTDAAGAPKTAANAGDYRIKLSTMDNAYSDTSDSFFSLANPSFSLTAPNSGESWVAGTSHDITWTSTGTIINARIEYSSNNGTDWTNVIASTTNDGSHTWTIPNTISNQCLVRISDATNASINDVSNAVFSITTSPVPSITVNAPSSGAKWQRGLTYAINWTKNATQNAYVKISLYKGTGTLVSILTSKTANDGSFNWLVPRTLAVGSTYFIRIQTIDSLVSGNSGTFSIIVPTITITAPAGGAVWTRGSASTITWRTTGTQNANVKIQLRKGTALILSLTLSTANDGSFNWNIPKTLVTSSLYKIAIITVDGLVIGAGSLFTIK